MGCLQLPSDLRSCPRLSRLAPPRPALVSFVTADSGASATAGVTGQLRPSSSPDNVSEFSGFSTLYGLVRHPSSLVPPRHSPQLDGAHEVRVPCACRTRPLDWRGRFRMVSVARVHLPLQRWRPTDSVAMFGDMGLFPQLDNVTHEVPIVPGPASHAIGNLIDDRQAGRIDWVAHSGDHAYGQ